MLLTNSSLCFLWHIGCSKSIITLFFFVESLSISVLHSELMTLLVYCAGDIKHLNNKAAAVDPCVQDWCLVYLCEFAVQHLEFSEFPLDAPATVGRFFSFHQANTHTVTSYSLTTFLCSLKYTQTYTINHHLFTLERDYLGISKKTPHNPKMDRCSIHTGRIKKNLISKGDTFLK